MSLFTLCNCCSMCPVSVAGWVCACRADLAAGLMAKLAWLTACNLAAIAGQTSATPLCLQTHIDWVYCYKIRSQHSLFSLAASLSSIWPHHMDNSRQTGQPWVFSRRTWCCQPYSQIGFWNQPEFIPCSPAWLRADTVAVHSVIREELILPKNGCHFH